MTSHAMSSFTESAKEDEHIEATEETGDAETLEDLNPGDWSPSQQLLIIIGQDSDIDPKAIKSDLEGQGIEVSETYDSSKAILVMSCDKVASIPEGKDFTTYVSGHCLDLEGRDDLLQSVMEYMGDGLEVEDNLVDIAFTFQADAAN